MRPSVLAVSFFSSPGAVADNFHTLAQSLARQSDLSVLTSSLIADRPISGVQEVRYLDFPKSRPLRWLLPSQWLELVRFSRKRLYDLLFLYSEHPLHVVAASVARARRRAFWCLDPLPHSGSVSTTAAVYELAKGRLVQRANHVIVACEALRRETISRYDIPESRVISSFHGVLENLLFPDLTGREPRDIDLLFFGRLEAYKGVDIFIEAVRLLRARHQLDPRVTIAGTGTYRVPSLAGVTADNRYVPDRELAELVARARIVVMPYRDATGSQVPQTAFAYGTPVVATAVGCLPEYVTDGVNGLIVPPNEPSMLADALRRLLGDQTLWSSLSAGARKTAVETFSNDTLTARLLGRILE